MNSNRKAAACRLAICSWVRYRHPQCGLCRRRSRLPSQSRRKCERGNDRGIFSPCDGPRLCGYCHRALPGLRQYHPHLAFGFAGFRVIAGGFIILGVVFLLLILTLSQEFVRAGAPEAAYFQTLGVLLQADVIW